MGTEMENCVFILGDKRINTIPHELGHSYLLEHIFEEAKQGQRTIPQETTKNFMDYSLDENMFYLYQIRDIRRKIKEILNPIKK